MRVFGAWRFASTRMRSASALVIPITLTGLHALSVETPTTTSTLPASRTARARFAAPPVLVRNASWGKYSQVGTCLSAAAWTMTSASATAQRSAS